MILIVLIFLLIFIKFWMQKKFARKNYLLSKIPCLPKYPIIHHIPYVVNNKTSDHFYFLVNLGKELGGFYHLSFGDFIDPYIFVSDPKFVEGFLTSNDELDKGIDYDLLKPWIGTGLATSSDEKWFKRRKLLTPGFHFQILERFVKVMDESSEMLIEKLNSLQEKLIDVYPIASLFALDTVCECTMGTKLNSQNFDCDYARAVKEISHIIMVRTYDPIKRIDFLYQFTEMYQRERKVLKLLHDFGENVIEMRREELLKNEEEDSKCKKTLLDIMLTSTIDGVSLTNEDIREEVDTFLFAGHGTLSSALSFILLNIAKYPEVQQKIYEEISVNDQNEKLSVSMLNSLKYIELVIKETLRMTPPAAFVGRRLKEEVTIEGVTFPKHANILMSTYIMGHNEKYFKDPELFIPERFDVETTYEKINPFAYVPFSAGPRNCIGQKLATLILRAAIFKIIKNFKISLKDDHEDPLLCMEIVVRPVDGIFMKFQNR